MEKTENWKPKTLIIGGIIGLLIGLLASYLLIQQAEQQQTKPSLSAGDGVKLGIGVLGVLRSLSDVSAKK